MCLKLSLSFFVVQHELAFKLYLRLAQLLDSAFQTLNRLVLAGLAVVQAHGLSKKADDDLIAVRRKLGFDGLPRFRLTVGNQIEQALAALDSAFQLQIILVYDR
ncbi:hypothetical protein [Methylomonas koyamae]|uniref:hypothetical protein n=1 Tax=Methylomonas koyamae TaxID=702114 RepID=UPI0012F6D383|nr:hypothetical protein [Methylomonas koyamae]